MRTIFLYAYRHACANNPNVHVGSMCSGWLVCVCTCTVCEKMSATTERVCECEGMRVLECLCVCLTAILRCVRVCVCVCV